MTKTKSPDVGDVETTFEQSIGDGESSRLDGLRNMFVFENSKIDAYKSEAERLLKKHGSDSTMAAGAAARVANSTQFARELKTHISAAETTDKASGKTANTKTAATKNPQTAAAKPAKPATTKAPPKEPGK